ncbi:MAG: DUF1465 family protein [Rhodospirillaceae bacterium]|nr:DUF1465 family protein [Rhodospirillaceae bacterium]MDD9924501.1 DUF1465 family protein [Rhodospirillaceae bacterium]
MDSALTPTYFTALHDEAFSLLVESRDYIARVRAQREQRSLDQSGYLDVTLETMRLTTRLTQVMAWILAQRAVHSEELTPEEGASRAYQLSGQAVCLDNVSGQAGHLPEELRELLQRSYQLYQRVSRLEAQINGRMAAPEGTPERQPSDGTPYLRPVTTSDQNPRTAY